MRQIIAVLCALLLLSSCGFKPRGAVPLAPPLHSLYLETSDPYGQLARYLTQYLRASGVNIVASAKAAETVLEILSETTGQQLLSVGGTQQTRQYSLTLTVSFQITDPLGRVLVPAQSVTQSRTIPIQSNQILGGSNEANNLYRQMRQSIVYDIMTRLGSNQTTTLVMKKPVLQEKPVEAETEE